MNNVIYEEDTTYFGLYIEKISGTVDANDLFTRPAANAAQECAVKFELVATQAWNIYKKTVVSQNGDTAKICLNGSASQLPVLKFKSTASIFIA